MRSVNYRLGPHHHALHSRVTGARHDETTLRSSLAPSKSCLPTTILFKRRGRKVHGLFSQPVPNLLLYITDDWWTFIALGPGSRGRLRLQPTMGKRGRGVADESCAAGTAASTVRARRPPLPVRTLSPCRRRGPVRTSCMRPLSATGVNACPVEHLGPLPPCRRT
jgi:hypothetical protein